MKNLLFILGMVFMFASCNKENMTKPVEIPQKFAYLKGEWKVIDYYFNEKDSPDYEPSEHDLTEPYFDELRIHDYEVELVKNGEVIELKNHRFNTDSKTDLTVMTVAVAGLNFQLYHEIHYSDGVLHLKHGLENVGIDYWLVRK